MNLKSYINNLKAQTIEQSDRSIGKERFLLTTWQTLMVSCN